MNLGSLNRVHLLHSDEVLVAPFVLGCACMRACKRGCEGEITCWACLYRLPGRIPCGLLELLYILLWLFASLLINHGPFYTAQSDFIHF